MRRPTTDKTAAPKAATFLDHTMVNGTIISTRLQRLGDKALLLEVGREYLSGMREAGEHTGGTLPYTVRHDWPTVNGHKVDLSGSVNMRPISLWTVDKDDIDDHTALFIPAYEEPDWATEELRPDPEMILVSVILLSLAASASPHPADPSTEEIGDLARTIVAQRPVLVTVPLLPARMVGGEPVLALDLLGQEYDVHRAQMATLSIAIASALMAESYMTTTHVYVPHPDVDAGVVPTAFTTEEFMAYHREHTAPVVADDDSDGSIAFVRHARVGALKLQEVSVDGVPRVLWVVQPGYYSEDFGLELPE